MTPEQGMSMGLPERSPGPEEGKDSLDWSLNTPERRAALIERFTQELHRNPEGAAQFPLPEDEKEAILSGALQYYRQIGDIAPALTLLRSFDLPPEVLEDEDIRRWAAQEYENFKAYPAEAEEIRTAFRLPA